LLTVTQAVVEHTRGCGQTVLLCDSDTVEPLIDSVSFFDNTILQELAAAAEVREQGSMAAAELVKVYRKNAEERVSTLVSTVAKRCTVLILHTEQYSV
jgi:aminoglycoside phosphotransferase family enzyme